MFVCRQFTLYYITETLKNQTKRSKQADTEIFGTIVIELTFVNCVILLSDE